MGLRGWEEGSLLTREGDGCAGGPGGPTRLGLSYDRKVLASVK